MLALATAVFLATHFVPSTPLRPVLVGAMGEWPYRGLYSAIAAATLGWMIWAYAKSPPEALLWTPLRQVPYAVMPLAFILIVCGYWRNPTLVGAEKLLQSEDPARGIIRITRHPLMWGVMLWAIAHILARPTLGALIFFGGFFALAGLGTLFIDARKKNLPEFQRFAAVTSNLPFVALAQGRNRIRWGEIGWLRPGIGVAVYFGVLSLHP